MPGWSWHDQNGAFVIGDNCVMSMRNHDFGPTTRDRIVGRPLF